MSTFDNSVSIHPYFKIQSGQMEACMSFLAQFTERSRTRRNACTTISPSKTTCCAAERLTRMRTACSAHLENCGDLLGEFLKIADLTRIEASRTGRRTREAETDVCSI